MSGKFDPSLLAGLAGGEIEVMGQGARYMYRGIATRVWERDSEAGGELVVIIERMVICRDPSWELRAYPSHSIKLDRHTYDVRCNGVIVFDRSDFWERVVLRPPSKVQLDPAFIRQLWADKQAEAKAEARAKAVALAAKATRAA